MRDHGVHVQQAERPKAGVGGHGCVRTEDCSPSDVRGVSDDSRRMDQAKKVAATGFELLRHPAADAASSDAKQKSVAGLRREVVGRGKNRHADGTSIENSRISRQKACDFPGVVRPRITRPLQDLTAKAAGSHDDDAGAIGGRQATGTCVAPAGILARLSREYSPMALWGIHRKRGSGFLHSVPFGGV